MSIMRIPAKKTMVPDTSLMDIDNIWDYIDFTVEEKPHKEPENNFFSFFSNDDEYCNCDDSWEDSHNSYRDDYDWRSDYRDAFEDDPEAYWGREW